MRIFYRYKNSDDTSTGRKKTITISKSNSITSKSIKDNVSDINCI